MSFHCLLNTGGRHISNETRNELVKKACEMARHRVKRLKIKSPGCEGFVYTQWKRGSMGSIVGVKFKAEVVLESGETTVTYIMRDFDLENMSGEWHGFNSIEEVEQAEALAERQKLPRNKKMLN